MLTSIIIPSLNEEKNLPELLKSIKNQGLGNNELEVIVADASSIDRTREISLIYECKVVGGGLPAKARNNGAECSAGDILIFKDADSTFPSNFLKPALKEFHERDLDIAGTLHYPIFYGNSFKALRYSLYIDFFENKSMLKAQKSMKPLMADCIFARGWVHKLISGFDETLEFGEDCDYAKRAKRAGAKFGILETCGAIGMNMRKFEENELRMLLKNVYYNAGRFFGHEFKRGKTLIKYWK